MKRMSAAGSRPGCDVIAEQCKARREEHGARLAVAAAALALRQEEREATLAMAAADLAARREELEARREKREVLREGREPHAGRFLPSAWLTHHASRTRNHQCVMKLNAIATTPREARLPPCTLTGARTFAPSPSALHP